MYEKKTPTTHRYFEIDWASSDVRGTERISLYLKYPDYSSSISTVLLRGSSNGYEIIVSRLVWHQSVLVISFENRLIDCSM